MRRWILTAALSMAVFVLLGTPATAFHDQGVADCSGCHTMHNSQDGALVDPDSPNGNAFLLVDETPSDVCLGCHATGLGAVFAVDELNPAPEKGGGNFIFLLEDNINDGHEGALNPILGDAAGHNVIAPGFGLSQDGTLGVAPGGTYSSSALGCTSCHDPHGNLSFRLLYGSYKTGYSNDAPDAEGLSIFFGSESNGNHTAYKSGMSEWCANCHGDFHDDSLGTPFRHVNGFAMGATIAGNYGSYNGSDDPSGGAPATSYLAAVPYEDAAAATNSTAAPTGSSQVMCISCHRAHATSAPDAGRWDFNVTFLHEDGLESGSYAIPDPYSSVNQRSLCNKCHVKDANSGPFVP